MTEPNANKPKGDVPIIRGYTREGQTPAEVTMWMNTPKEGEPVADKAPDFRGHLLIGGKKFNASFWAYAGGKSKDKVDEKGEPKEFPPYLSVAVSIKEGDGYRNESLDGTLRAMVRTTVDNAKIDVDGSRGLKIIGELKGKTILTEGVTVSGNLNGRFPEQDFVMDLARNLGFSETAVAGFKAFVEKDATKAATARP